MTAAAHLGVLVTLIALIAPRLVYHWPFYFVAPLAIYAVIVVGVPALRRSAAGWWRLGRFDGPVVGWVALISAVAAGGLLLYARVYEDQLRMLHWDLPRGGPLFMAGVTVGFSVVNALMEEAIFRGVLQPALERIVRSPAAAIVLQAIPYGLMHVEAFPRGAVGVGLATAYGVALGILRKRTGGLAAPVLSHALVDGVIFILLSSLSR